MGGGSVVGALRGAGGADSDVFGGGHCCCWGEWGESWGIFGTKKRWQSGCVVMRPRVLPGRGAIGSAVSSTGVVFMMLLLRIVMGGAVFIILKRYYVFRHRIHQIFILSSTGHSLSVSRDLTFWDGGGGCVWRRLRWRTNRARSCETREGNIS